jgi:hypothetical protein
VSVATAAVDEDAREREVARIMKAIRGVLPNPMTPNQHAFIENAVVANLNGEF